MKFRSLANKNYPIVIFSVVLGLIIWQVAGMSASTLVASPVAVLHAFFSGVSNGVLVKDTLSSLGRVFAGFMIALISAIVFGFIFGWYTIPRLLFDPWIQFFRMIPPIALIPLVVVYLGVGEEAKIFVIFVAAFLVMIVTIYQGVKQMDATLIRAARVLGANDRVLFFKVILPASLPHVFTAIRLGISTSWTTLVAAELIAASSGLGFMIQQASSYFEIPIVYLGIVIIGVIGIVMDRIVILLESKLTSWQEKVR